MHFRQSDGTWLQIGVVSFGSNKGCEEGYPNGFTRVSSYASWIHDTIQLIANSAFSHTGCYSLSFFMFVFVYLSLNVHL